MRSNRKPRRRLLRRRRLRSLRRRNAVASPGSSAAEPVTRSPLRRLPDVAMGDGNARNGRRHWLLGLQIAGACIVVLIGAFAVGAAVAGPLFWYPCSLDGLEAHGPAHASV